MSWTVLKTEKDYNRASECLIDIFHAEPDTPKYDELSLLILLVEDYDDRHYTLPQVDVLD
ncbi:MAG: hypothetical protein RBR78_10835 [Flavobacteriaceae bacterium]|jgi:HTH-type transcriptional regulator/antitoxin HigA|nr:hypothetical protein [Flavobacteriaceae bacterium]